MPYLPITVPKTSPWMPSFRIDHRILYCRFDTSPSNIFLFCSSRSSALPVVGSLSIVRWKFFSTIPHNVKRTKPYLNYAIRIPRHLPPQECGCCSKWPTETVFELNIPPILGAVQFSPYVPCNAWRGRSSAAARPPQIRSLPLSPQLFPCRSRLRYGGKLHLQKEKNHWKGIAS